MHALLKVATAVAAELDGKWSAGNYRYGSDASLAGPNGERVRLCQSPYVADKGRIAIHATFPDELRDHRRYNEPRYGITVSAEKTPRKIAQDITRRLLPDYRAGLELARARKAETDKAVAIKNGVMASLQSILDGQVIGGDTLHVEYQRFAEVRSDEVTFTWRVDHGQAVAFARFVAGLSDGGAS